MISFGNMGRFISDAKQMVYGKSTSPTVRMPWGVSEQNMGSYVIASQQKVALFGETYEFVWSVSTHKWGNSRSKVAK